MSPGRSKLCYLFCYQFAQRCCSQGQSQHHEAEWSTERRSLKESHTDVLHQARANAAANRATASAWRRTVAPRIAAIVSSNHEIRYAPQSDRWLAGIPVNVQRHRINSETSKTAKPERAIGSRISHVRKPKNVVARMSVK